jgi:hypothetical protein
MITSTQGARPSRSPSSTTSCEGIPALRQRSEPRLFLHPSTRPTAHDLNDAPHSSVTTADGASATRTCTCSLYAARLPVASSGRREVGRGDNSRRGRALLDDGAGEKGVNVNESETSQTYQNRRRQLSLHIPSLPSPSHLRCPSNRVDILLNRAINCVTPLER